MRKKSLAIVALATGLVMASTFNSLAGWVSGEYQDEGIDWYYYDDNAGVL